MAKLYFYYSAMNAGKSTVLLQSSHNYQERGMKTLLLTPTIDQRAGVGKIASRIGLAKNAHPFSTTDDLFSTSYQVHTRDPIACVLIDEAQFLTEIQVRQLSRVADEIGIPVLCYGLRTDFLGNLFPGSAALLGWADNLIELKTICQCSRKATMNLRTDENGNPIKEGDQVDIGGNERYVAMCRKCFVEAMDGGKATE
jgi:thymidine kinase